MPPGLLAITDEVIECVRRGPVIEGQKNLVKRLLLRKRPGRGLSPQCLYTTEEIKAEKQRAFLDLKKWEKEWVGGKR
jgi:hypothetical protein